MPAVSAAVGGSAPARVQVLSVIGSAGPRGLGVIFISHTLPHVLQVTDRIVVLRLGSVVRDSPTSAFTAASLLGTITGCAGAGEPPS